MGAWIEILIISPSSTDFLSLLSWERGLKFVLFDPCFLRSVVAPLVGAWIEIDILDRLAAAGLCVAPLVGAWIEIKLVWDKVQSMIVAPLVGAWIEIRVKSQQNVLQTVAPLVGAWIEMSKNLY